MSTDKPINGTRFIEWLETAGIIPHKTHRVVIDAQAQDVVMIYVEMFGGSKMLEVTPAAAGLAGAIVQVVDKPAPEPPKPDESPTIP